MAKLPELLEKNAALIAKHKVVNLCESTERGDGRMRVQGPSQRIGVRNANGRIYPRSVWEKNLAEGSDFSTRLKSRQALGELEHPEGGNTRLFAVSHLMEKAWIDHLPAGNEFDVEEGDYVVTQSLILDTPNGNVLKELFSVGVPVGISSRGRGNTVKSEDDAIVQDDYELSVWDYVENPSVIEARHRVLGEAGALPPPGDNPGSPPPSPGGDLPMDIVPPVDDLGKKPPKIKSPPDIVARADTLVSKMKEVVVAGKKDVASIAELFSQSLHLLDDIGAAEDPEFSKIRGEVLALSDVLAQLLGGGTKKSKSSSDFPPKKKEDSPEEKEETSEAVELGEADPNVMVGARVVLPDGRTGAITSYQLGDGNPQYWVRAEDGTPLKAYDVSQLRISNEPGRQQIAQQQAGVTEDVQIDITDGRSISMGKENVGANQVTESAGKVIAVLAEKNVDQKKQLEGLKDAVPMQRYENLKKLCEKTIDKAKETATELTALQQRYEAAKKLIGGLVERIKKQSIGSAVDEQIREHASLEPVREILQECKSVEDVAKKAESLLKVVGVNESGSRSRTRAPVISEDGNVIEEKVHPETSHSLIGSLAKRGM